ncbi:hypothetical protein KJ633_04950 [bacterium]|nr:hypothetical protein [bacterium]
MSEIILDSLRDLLIFVPKTLFIMFISLTVTWALIRKGIIDKISFIGKPLTGIIGLPDETGIAFITSFGSSLSGNVMLSDFNKQGILTDYQTYLASLFSSIPIYIKESFIYQIPVIIPILGFKVGLIYFACFLFSGFVKLLFVAVSARVRLTGINSARGAGLKLKAPAKSIRISYINQLKIFFRMGGIYASVTFIIFILVNSGYISHIEKFVSPLTDILKLPTAVAVPVGTYIFSPLAGASSIGAMLQNGNIAEIDAMIAVLLGSFLMLPVFMIRGSLAKYTSIFGTSLGIKIILTSTIIGMGTRLIFLIALLMVRGF